MKLSVEICKRDGSPQDPSRKVILFIPTAGSSISPNSEESEIRKHIRKIE